MSTCECIYVLWHRLKELLSVLSPACELTLEMGEQSGLASQSLRVWVHN